VTIGAVGLGSSNDVHKPYGSTLAGLPVRLDFDRAAPTDVGCLALDACRRFFLVNASAGVTAEANAFFNRPDATLRLLKSFSTPSAIAYAALRTIFRHGDVPATITSDGREMKNIGLSSIAILKSPHFSGDLRYPEGAGPGRFSIYLQHAFNRRELARLMMGLRRGSCAITERSLHWHADDVSISALRPFPVEYDGETLMTTSVRCTVCPAFLRICP
jgi:diacylglycerol kinase family enzyme